MIINKKNRKLIIKINKNLFKNSRILTNKCCKKEGIQLEIHQIIKKANLTKNLKYLYKIKMLFNNHIILILFKNKIKIITHK